MVACHQQPFFLFKYRQDDKKVGVMNLVLAQRESHLGSRC